MNKKNMLSTGEFAKICKVTKQTLFHYDAINLLKPKHISGKGYRRYGVEQFFDFDMIAAFKETGSSLKEIKKYVHGKSTEDFLALFEAKRVIFRKEREQLAHREHMLKDMQTYTREALDFTYDTFMVQRQEEERLEFLPTMPFPVDSLPEIVDRFVEYVDFYATKQRKPRLPFGMVLDRDGEEHEMYLGRYLFSRATRSTPRSQLHVKPEGEYAILAHTGTIPTHKKALTELLGQIKSAGLAVASYVYAYDMMSYFLHGSGEVYATKYCIQVE
jgi:DNA-binding transcriptional MerR regulator